MEKKRENEGGGFVFKERYSLVKKLGGGGFGEVWEVFDRHRQGKAAMKVIDLEAEGAREAFERERMILASQTERYFPVLYDSFLDGSNGIIVMEYVQGRDLREIVQTEGPLSLEEAVSHIWNVCDMLEFLHSLRPRFLYLDLKPENLILETGGRLRLLDFGAVQGEGQKALFGTPGFSAPEVWERGNGIFPSTASDTYSLGALLFFLMTGFPLDRPPYRILEIRQFAPAVSPRFSAFLQKACSEDPQMRFWETSEFKAGLERALKQKRFFLIRKPEKRFRILQTVWHTEKLIPGLFSLAVILAAISINGNAQSAELQEYVAKPMPDMEKLNVREEMEPAENGESIMLLDQEGRSVLVRDGKAYHPEGDLRMVLPKKMFRIGEEYQVVILMDGASESFRQEYHIQY